MPWPQSQDYNEAIQSPRTSFTDAELRDGEVAVNALGVPMPCSGNFADVYRVNCPASKRSWAVKCFTRQIPGLRERYQQISSYLEQVKLPFMVGFTFVEQGIKVRGAHYPILKMEWAEGMPLNQLVREHLSRPQVLDKLSQMWVKLAGRLREAKLAHCDLQHGNVLLVPQTKTGLLGMKLVDYDGMCVPALAKSKSPEAGHPAFQHPQRLREGAYDLEIDRFSHLVIYTALRGLLASGRPLWDRYDNGDNLLFCQDDFKVPDKSGLIQELLQSDDAEVRCLAEVVRKAAQKPLDATPLLSDVAGVQTTTAVSALMNPPKVAKAAVPSVDTSSEQPKTGLFAALRSSLGALTVRQRRMVWGALAGFGTLFVLASVGLVALVMFVLNAPSEPDRGKVHVVVADAKTEKPDKNVPAPKTEEMKEVEPPKVQPQKVEPAKVVKPPSESPVIQGEWVDLLKSIDPEKHRVRGFWRFEGGALVSDEAAYTRLQIPYAPGGEYSLRLTAEARSGKGELFIGLPVPGPNRAIAFIARPTLGGLSLVDKKLATSNQSTTKGVTLTPGKPNKIVCNVTETAVNVSVDDREVVNWVDGFERLTFPKDLWVPNDKAIVIGSTNCPVHISRIEVKRLDAQSHFLHGTLDNGTAVATDFKLLTNRIAGTEWINSAQERLEWDSTGKFYYKGNVVPAFPAGQWSYQLRLENGTHFLTFDPDLNTFEQIPPGPLPRPLTGKRVPASNWFNLRVSAVIDKKATLQISPTQARWINIEGEVPSKVKVHKANWDLQNSPVQKYERIADLFGTQVDFKTVKFTKILGTGTTTFKSDGSTHEVVIDNTLKAGQKAVAYDFLLSFRTGDISTQTTKESSRFAGHLTSVNAVAISPDGKLVASFDVGRAIRLWELHTGKERWQLVEPVPLTAICFLNQNSIACSSSNGWIRIVDTATGTKIERHKLENNIGNLLQAMPDGRRLLFSTQNDSIIRSFDVIDSKLGEMLTPDGVLGAGNSLVGLSATGKRALSNGKNFGGGGLVWELPARKGAPIVRLNYSGNPTAGALSPDASLAAICTPNSNSTELYDGKSGKIVGKTAPWSGAANVTSVSFSARGDRMLSAHIDGEVRILDTTTLHELGKFKGDDKAGPRIAKFTPDGRHVVVADSDKIIRVWTVPE